MRICVFGAGSLGSAMGALLASHHDVTLVGRSANTSPIKSDGLVLQGAVTGTIRLDATDTIENLDPPDLLLIATKAYSTPSVIEVCDGWLGKDACVLTLQNGLGNLEMLRTWRGDKAFGGTTTMGSSLVRPGVVRIAGIGKTMVGSDRDARTAGAIASSFRAAGVPTIVRKDVFGQIWAKAIINASINPLTAILRVPNGELIKSQTLSRLMAEICAESELVAAESGVRLPAKSMYPLARYVAEETASNRSSMLRDVELGRRTEIAHINGRICRHGEAAGVPTPLNKALVSIVESIEAGTAEKG